jgi:hypothetical protein
MNQRFTDFEISNICHTLRNSAQGRIQGKNYYRFEELMMIYLNIDPLAQDARKTLKSYIDKNYKVITCNEYLSHPEGGILVNLASARNLGQLTTFVEQYEIDYSSLEDSQGNKIIPWLESKVSDPNTVGKETFRGFINYFEGLSADDEDDSFF